jgi:hypothetical protein
VFILTHDLTFTVPLELHHRVDLTVVDPAFYRHHRVFLTVPEEPVIRHPISFTVPEA